MRAFDHGPRHSFSFELLTERQREVLDLLIDDRTSKEIAAGLGISPSAVNQHIETVRFRMDGIPRAELTRRYRVFRSREDATCKQFPSQTLHLVDTPADRDTQQLDAADGLHRFGDSMTFTVEAPWSEEHEPRVLPRLLDGENAGLLRIAVIALVLFAIVAALVLGLAAAEGVTKALGGGRPGSESTGRA